MKNLVLLLILLVCVLAYVHTEQPATWNSWVTALGANNMILPAADSDSSTMSASPAPADSSAAPAPAPARVAPVGGLIRNGNFVAGEGSWQGDGSADPSGRGLVVRLSQTTWTRVYQTFPDQGTQNSIEITYTLSPGFAASRDPADYTDISKHLQISGFENYPSLGLAPGQFYGTVGDPGASSIAMEVFSPQLSSTGIQDYRHDYPAIPASGSTTFALAFPPGTGTVTLLTAYVKSR